MKPLRNNYITVIVIIAMMLAGACQSGQKGSPVLIPDVDEVSSGSGLESFSQIIYLYPSPAEMLSVIDMSELSFDASLLNPSYRADQYIDSQLKTFALGIYMTDLAYSALFLRHEESLNYLELIKSLAEDININEAVDEAMIEKVRKNVDYLDSLYNISNEAFVNVLSFCERNEKPNTIVMLSAGAFIESLYLAVHMVEDYETADLLLQHLADQKYTIDNFMLFAYGLQTDDPSVVSILKDLERIKIIYDGIKPGAGGVTVKTAVDSDETQPKKLVIGGTGKANQPSLSEEEFESLKAVVIELRNKAVSTNP